MDLLDADAAATTRDEALLRSAEGCEEGGADGCSIRGDFLSDDLVLAPTSIPAPGAGPDFFFFSLTDGLLAPNLHTGHAT